jgi:AcrR family transcriptional regulator
MPASKRDRDARQRLLDTAGALFYRQGYHAIGVDRVVAESGISKMTLYRHFASKDALIVAYLMEAQAEFWGWIEQVEAAAGLDPGARLRAFLGAIAKQSTDRRCLGCAFQLAAGEFPAHDHPGHRAAIAYKESVREHLRQLVKQAGAAQPTQLADQLMLLIDGAWASARMYGARGPATAFSAAAEVILQQGLGTHG